MEGHYDEEPFSLARASNRAAKLAGDWQTAFYVGADFLLADPQQALEAVAVAERTGQLTFAHDVLVQLDEQETADLMAGDPAVLPRGAGIRHPNTFSGALAVPRALWDEAGGFDERFVDWGGDDISFWAACCALRGGFQRVAGDAFHLWHPRSRAENEENSSYPSNHALMCRYLDAKHSSEEMLRILREPGGPHGG